MEYTFSKGRKIITLFYLFCYFGELEFTEFKTQSC